MSNINVRIIGTANVTQMSGAFGKLEAQVTQLNAQLARMVALQNGVDPTGYQRMANAAAHNSKVFRNAAASTGMFEVQQLKVNKATDEYIRKLQRQQLSFRDMIKQRKVASAAYREQLAMEQMVVRQARTGTVHGKSMLDVTYPKEISKDLDTAANRMAFMNEQLKSGARQMVNWGKNTQWAGRQLMVGFTMPVAAFGAAAAVASYQVDKELTRITKVYDMTHNSMSADLKEVAAAERETLKVREQATDTAIKAARAYGAAGTDTLNVQSELAATGLKGAQLQQYTNEVMRISALGELEYADSIQTAISLQSVFGMSTQELTKAFNYMNAVENATSLQTKDFAQAIPIAAAPVKAFGGDIEELGVLLTAMKERGIEATQGANAIKAAMQRLGRPSKQIQEEWTSLTGTDITKIFDDATSLTDLFTQIREATRNLTDKEQIKAFAGLFGTYQVTRMSALVEGMDDLAAGTGQVSKAMQLASADASTLADVASREISQQAESISGQWDRAFQELKLQMSTLGKPFLQFGTVVIKGVSALINAFNDLPGPVKVAIASMLGIAAIAGPIIMLIGLFANLFGNAIAGWASLGKVMTRFSNAIKIATTDQRAAAMAAEASSSAYATEASAAAMLTMQLEKLSLAEAAAARATQDARVSQLMAGGMTRGAAYGQMVAESAVANKNAGGTTGPTTVLAGASTQIASNSEKTRSAWKGVAGNMGLAAAAGSMMLMSSEGTLGNIAEVVFYASLLGPMLAPLGGMLIRGFKGAVGAAGGLTGVVRTVGAGFVGLLNPVTLIGTAVAAVGIGLWKWHEHLEAIAAQERAQERAIVSRSNLLAESLDMQIRKQKELNTLSATGLTGPDEMSSAELAHQLESTQSGRDLVSAYTDADTSEKAVIAAQKYSQVLDAIGGNSRKARQYVEALFIAAGDGALEAQRKATELFNKFAQGDPSVNRINLLSQMIDNNGPDTQMAEAWTQGQSIGKEIADGMASVVRNQRGEEWNKYADMVRGKVIGVFKGASEETRGILRQLGIDSAEELSKVASEYEMFARGDMTAESFTASTGISPNSIQGQNLAMALGQLPELRNVAATERAIVQELARQLGIKEKIYTITQLQQTREFKMQTLSRAQLENQARHRLVVLDNADAMDRMRGSSSGITYETKLMELNTWRVAAGLKETGTLSDMFGKRTTDVNGNLIKTGPYIKKANGEIIRGTAALRQMAGAAGQVVNAVASLSGQDFLSAAQSGMQGVQEDMADDMRAAFDDRMNNALEQRQNYWDNRADALSNEMDRRSDALQDRQEAASAAMDARHEAQQEAFDKKWEARTDAAEKYWDHRVELVDKAIEHEQKAEEMRQRMFDAEIARIQKLNEAANQSIDFNVALSEGRFDEAAKIRNDAEAAMAQTALERGASAGSLRSDRRVDKLEGKKTAIEKARDKAMARLTEQEEQERASMERVQEAQKAHLAAMQEAETEHLQAVSEARQEALQNDAEADMETQREIWESRKESLEDQLELFLSFIARNEKELKQHMKNVGLSYDKFGKEVLKPKGENWATYFGDRLKFHIRKAGLDLASDHMWEKLGNDSLNSMLKGMGFSSMSEFRHFISTGKFGGGGGKGSGNGNPAARNTGGSANNPRDNMGGVTAHEGGMLGEGKDSRKGVARTLRGTHPNEVRLLAQKGEYLVNKDDAAANRDVLDKINSGAYRDSRSNVGDGTGGGPGMPGLVSGALNMAMAHGIGMAMTSAYQKKKAQLRRQRKRARSAGNWGTAKPGKYGDAYFSADQLRNAAIIADVGGKLGASQRDIQIALMTAMQESTLRNLHYGDLDSVGLFQQRDAWGSFAERTNPAASARMFFLGGHAGQRGLFDFPNRGSMSLAQAAQSVQVSAFPDAYAKWANEASAILKAMKRTGGGSAAGYKPGSGGWHKASIPGKGWSNSHDYGNGLGSPLYAASDGTITDSRAITSGGSPGNGLYSTPYRSYGETIAMRTASGDVLRYAHLNPGQRYVRVGQHVKGGALIGRSGQTGNATGPHTHFDVNGSYNAKEWMQGKGIGLRSGGLTLSDGLARLHANEAVIDPLRTRKLFEGIDNLASGEGDTYNVNVDASGTNVSADEIANKVIKKIERLQQSKPKKRRND